MIDILTSLRAINVALLIGSLPPVIILLRNALMSRECLVRKLKKLNTALVVLFFIFLISGVVNIFTYIYSLMKTPTALFMNQRNIIVNIGYFLAYWSFWWADKQIENDGKKGGGK